MRVFRLFVGFFILSQGVQIADVFTIIMGFAFAAMALLNVGCFGGNCAVPSNNIPSSNKSNELQTDEVSFEEVK